MATGSELRVRVRNNLGGRDDKNSQILQAINVAIERLTTFHKWRSLEKLYSGSASADSEYFVLPTGVRKILSLWFLRDSSDPNTAVILERTTTYRHDRADKGHSQDRPFMMIPGVNDGASSTGEPRVYGRMGADMLWLYPIPNEDTTLYIRCYVAPTVPIVASDTHDLGTQLDHVIVAYATAEMYALLDLQDSARIWEGRAVQYAREVRSDQRQEPDWTPKSVIDGRPRLG